MSRRDKERLFALALLRAKRSRAGRDLDIVEKHRGDPLGFITEGLQQARGDSWHMWRVVLKAAYGRGSELTDDELAMFRSVAGGRNPPAKRVKQLWLIVGRRGGKDSVASMISTEAAVYADEGLALRPGERALVACFATDRDQASIIYNYTKAYFETIPSLRSRVISSLGNLNPTPIILNNDVELRVVTNNFRAPRGRAFVVAVFDEVAFWRSDESAAPDVETYNAVYPAIADVPNGMLIGISSPHIKKGILYDRYEKYYGKDDDSILVINGGTRTFRPTFSQAIIDEEIEKDAERANAEYMAEFRRDMAPYVDPDKVKACVTQDRLVLDPQYAHNYFAFCDPSGGSVDSMTLCIAHKDKDKAIVDCIAERRSPFNPDDVAKEFALTLKQYRLRRVVGDRYGGEWVKERFASHGITYALAEDTKSEIYQAFLPILNAGRAELLDHPRTNSQIVQLERRAVRGGRDIIDHPKNAHDDLANVVAGACTHVLDAVNQPIVISPELMAAAKLQTPQRPY